MSAMRMMSEWYQYKTWPENDKKVKESMAIKDGLDGRLMKVLRVES